MTVDGDVIIIRFNYAQFVCVNIIGVWTSSRKTITWHMLLGIHTVRIYSFKTHAHSRHRITHSNYVTVNLQRPGRHAPNFPNAECPNERAGHVVIRVVLS